MTRACDCLNFCGDDPAINKGEATPCERAKIQMAKPKTAIIPDAILNIGKLLLAQNDQYTANPMFVVERKRIVTGIDTDYCESDDDIVWIIEDSMIFNGDHEFSELEAGYNESATVPENYTRTGFSSHWEFVTLFFTQQAADNYISRHGHKHDATLRVSVESAYRNDEYQTVRDWLMLLATGEVSA